MSEACLEPQRPVTIPVAGSQSLFHVRRVYCVGRNYAEHAREMGFDPEREPPFFFCKPADAVWAVASGTTGEMPYPSLTKNLHYEIELVVAIGAKGTEIATEKAREHIFGYAVGLDMTRRDLQIGMREKGRPWEIGKAFDWSAPIAPIHPKASLSEIEKREIELKVNGTVKQKSDLTQLIWSIDEVISNLSTYFTLMPGDLIFTGTPAGVGPVVAGDLMVGSIEGLGELSVRMR
ncbi:MAG: fumarylacetoacetate hydrolase family protein [Burkholderiaceae bacterium]|jgi:fumarylpyruvate hydrolase